MECALYLNKKIIINLKAVIETVFSGVQRLVTSLKSDTSSGKTRTPHSGLLAPYQLNTFSP